MNIETFFTLGEYKQNYDKLKTEFVEAYEDNDEEEFISLQIEWYQKCSLNTELEWTVFDGDIGWFPKVLFNDKVAIWKVIEKFRNKNGGMNQTDAQNLNVSFKKILNLLNLKQEKVKYVRDIGKPSASQWSLYHYFLQKSNIMPPFQEKLKEIKALSKDYGIGWKNFEMKYNVINNSQGLEGYTEKDVKTVILLLKENFSSHIPEFEKLTLHVS